MATGYRAFVPDPLPPAFTWNTELVSVLSKTDHLLGSLGSEGKFFLTLTCSRDLLQHVKQLCPVK